jgi:hypothetical protein
MTIPPVSGNVIVGTTYWNKPFSRTLLTWTLLYGLADVTIYALAERGDMHVNIFTISKYVLYIVPYTRYIKILDFTKSLSQTSSHVTSTRPIIMSPILGRQDFCVYVGL